MTTVVIWYGLCAVFAIAVFIGLLALGQFIAAAFWLFMAVVYTRRIHRLR